MEPAPAQPATGAGAALPRPGTGFYLPLYGRTTAALATRPTQPSSNTQQTGRRSRSCGSRRSSAGRGVRGDAQHCGGAPARRLSSVSGAGLRSQASFGSLGSRHSSTGSSALPHSPTYLGGGAPGCTLNSTAMQQANSARAQQLPLHGSGSMSPTVSAGSSASDAVMLPGSYSRPGGQELGVAAAAGSSAASAAMRPGSRSMPYGLELSTHRVLDEQELSTADPVVSGPLASTASASRALCAADSLQGGSNLAATNLDERLQCLQAAPQQAPARVAGAFGTPFAVAALQDELMLRLQAAAQQAPSSMGDASGMPLAAAALQGGRGSSLVQATPDELLLRLQAVQRQVQASSATASGTPFAAAALQGDIGLVQATPDMLLAGFMALPQQAQASTATALGTPLLPAGGLQGGSSEVPCMPNGQMLPRFLAVPLQAQASMASASGAPLLPAGGLQGGSSEVQGMSKGQMLLLQQLLALGQAQEHQRLQGQQLQATLQQFLQQGATQHMQLGVIAHSTTALSCAGGMGGDLLAAMQSSPFWLQQQSCDLSISALGGPPACNFNTLVGLPVMQPADLPAALQAAGQMTALQEWPAQGDAAAPDDLGVQIAARGSEIAVLNSDNELLQAARWGLQLRRHSQEGSAAVAPFMRTTSSTPSTASWGCSAPAGALSRASTGVLSAVSSITADSIILRSGGTSSYPHLAMQQLGTGSGVLTPMSSWGMPQQQQAANSAVVLAPPLQQAIMHGAGSTILQPPYPQRSMQQLGIGMLTPGVGGDVPLQQQEVNSSSRAVGQQQLLQQTPMHGTGSMIRGTSTRALPQQRSPACGALLPDFSSDGAGGVVAAQWMTPQQQASAAGRTQQRGEYGLLSAGWGAVVPAYNEGSHMQHSVDFNLLPGMAGQQTTPPAVAGWQTPHQHVPVHSEPVQQLGVQSLHLQELQQLLAQQEQRGLLG